MTFEEYLQEIHAKDYVGEGDNIGWAFNEWLQELELDDWLLYGQQFGIKMGLAAIDTVEKNLKEAIKK